MFKILVVEDDPHILKLISVFLVRNGFDVMRAQDGEAALSILESAMPDLVICDIMMPRMDGYTLTRDLRSAYPDLPILMVTAREALEDKRKAFSVGTDDYMVKPIELDEMLFRINALLRRSRIATERELRLGETVLNYDSLTVSRRDVTLNLTKKEFLLLFKLLSYPGRTFTRSQLMDELWGMDVQSDERTVDVHIKRLREKCISFPEFQIITVRGLGYRAERAL